jgi:hypothetical protein
MASSATAAAPYSSDTLGDHFRDVPPLQQPTNEPRRVRSSSFSLLASSTKLSFAKEPALRVRDLL